MIVIDGSMGEGGGQILRTSIALSALTMTPIKIVNIRAKRRNPGLARQHVTVVKVIKALTNADVRGLALRSKTLDFYPRKRVSGSFKFDVGTAGSIPLILQAILPVMALAPGPINLTIIGGTDVPMSPPIDYIINVFLRYLNKMGYYPSISIVRRGHYPRGGGIVQVVSKPIEKLTPLNLIRRGRVVEIRGRSHCVKLPSHVAERQASSASRILREAGYRNISIDVEYYPPEKDPHLGPGSGIVLWALTSNESVLGADALGARGKPAEVVGREAATKLLEELKSEQALDSHLGDMIIPFLAIADGMSIVGTSKLTLHTITNIEVVRLILGVKVEVTGSLGEPGIIKVEGLGTASIK